MKTAVVKFGGTSLADAAQFQKVKSIIELDSARRFVINSAPGKRFSEDIKVTDMLYQCKANAGDKREFEKSLAKVSERFQGIINELGVELDIEPILKKIAAEISKGASDDYTASRGEYLNGRILALYLGYEFVDSAEIIKFRSDRTLDAEKTHSLAKARLKECKSAVIPGFYGSDDSGEIITFSRGGSDISGALVAKAVQADIYENWTDVSGMLATDPRIVKDPKPVAYISYNEIRHLASMGASVLHEDAVYPAKEAGIPINIRNTNEPKHPGTLVGESNLSADGAAGEPVGIAGKKGFSALHVSGESLEAQISNIEKLMAVLAPLKLELQSLNCSVDTISLFFEGELPAGLKGKGLEDKIKAVCNAEEVKWTADLAAVAAVGENLNKELALGKATTALSEAGIPVLSASAETRQNIILGVPAEQLNAALQSVYKGLYS